MANKVFLTGASGFVGGEVLAALQKAGKSVLALSNRAELEPAEGVTTVKASLFDPAALAAAMAGCDAVIHLVGIIREHKSKGQTFERVHAHGTRCVVEAARAAGLQRYVQMSALGTRPDATSAYHTSKFAAEEIVRQSGLAWTVFRPSLIHGERGEFMKMEAKWARKKAPPFLFMPYFGAGAMGTRGAGLLQPVHVKDVARAFVEALDRPGAVGEVYPLVGAQVVSWPQMHQLAARAIVGRRRWVKAIPAWYANLLTHIIPPFLLPFNRAQVAMSQEDNIGDGRKFADDFGWAPASFESTLQDYAKKL